MVGARCGDKVDSESFAVRGSYGATAPLASIASRPMLNGHTAGTPMKPHPMQQYHDMLERCLDSGSPQFNKRTGKLCYVLPGYQLQFDMRDGFPAVTTKRLAFGAVKGELLGFFRGYTSAADFRALGCKIWDQNANETAAWLANPHRKGTDDLGRIYGAQWTNWRDSRVVCSVEERDALLAKGFKQILRDGSKGAYLMERGINQLEHALRTIIENPSDRRIIVSAWRPDEFDRMALPACHVDYRFMPFEDQRRLHLVMTIRSWDLLLGAPFNIASSALFLHVMAHLAGYEAGTLTMQAANAHVYEDHVDQVRLQLSRDHFPQPTLLLSESVQQVRTSDEVAGAFARINPIDINLLNYQSHEAIKAPMAA